ncbi:MAG: RNA-binding S4 domain-containing protein [Rhodobacteraceae bacterium]|nr:RNA-binding S4 domain-containing protein [Paracoccaceae bacterium]MCP5340690.1 RNA-binding S4 domain-containing protein [Paracoccaceae bacterium]
MAAKPEPAAAPVRIRIDKWLWHARFFKTRSLAAAIVAKGGLRINGVKTTKPGHSVGPGDVLTFRQDRQVRVIRVLGCAARRGPAAEARQLYDDLEPQDDSLAGRPPR